MIEVDVGYETLGAARWTPDEPRLMARMELDANASLTLLRCPRGASQATPSPMSPRLMPRCLGTPVRSPWLYLGNVAVCFGRSSGVITVSCIAPLPRNIPSRACSRDCSMLQSTEYGVPLYGVLPVTCYSLLLCRVTPEIP